MTIHYKFLKLESNFIQFLKRVAIGSRTGRWWVLGRADSGINFDHIYQNVPMGRGFGGRLLDWIILHLPVTKATVNRKQKIKLVIQRFMEELSSVEKIRIVDLASGASRYVIEFFQEHRVMAEAGRLEGLCVDSNIFALRFGQREAKDLPILFKRANAFRLGHLTTFSEQRRWKPNIVLVSGLYEYVDDDLVVRSLKEICASMEERGFLLIVTPIGNANKFLTERLSKTNERGRWRIHHREPSTILHWLEENGFSMTQYEEDEWHHYGYFIGGKAS